MLLPIFIVTASEKVFVNQKTGKDSIKCLQESNTTAACRSLGYVASHLGSGTHGLTIVIQSNISLDRLYSFANSSFLRLQSDTRNKRVIKGLNHLQPCGLEFNCITNLSISNIAFSQCEAKVNFSSSVQPVSLHVNQSTNISITDILIMEQDC